MWLFDVIFDIYETFCKAPTISISPDVLPY